MKKYQSNSTKYEFEWKNNIFNEKIGNQMYSNRIKVGKIHMNTFSSFEQVVLLTQKQVILIHMITYHVGYHSCCLLEQQIRVCCVNHLPWSVIMHILLGWWLRFNYFFAANTVSSIVHVCWDSGYTTSRRQYLGWWLQFN